MRTQNILPGDDGSGITVFGKMCQPPFRAFCPPEVSKYFGIRTHSPSSGHEFGIPKQDCAACHQVMTGSAVACTAHGFRRNG